MSSSRRKLVLNSVSVNIGCGSCRRPKLGHIFNINPKLPKNSTYQIKHNKLYHHSSSSFSSSSTTTTTTTTTFSPCYVDSSSQFCEDVKSSKTKRGFGRVGTEGVVVVKDSEDPYLDFKQSMLQMILENEIYSKDDLRELLNCFLQLNSPNNHGVIVRAFTEIWNGVFSVRSKSNYPTRHLSRDF